MGGTILDTIAAYARERVAADQEKVPQAELEERASRDAERGRRFTHGLARDGLSFICEVKKASPSKGVISEDFPYLDIAREYEAAGADAISCLTEPRWFLGSDGIFREIAGVVGMPMLRKDFVVDAYQVWQAADMGASAVLLICALLDTDTLADHLALAGELGMAALVEAHDADEVRSAVSAGARIIGVNNRNLKDFSVDFANAARLRDLVPPGILFVAESGVAGPEDAAALRRIGADAVLMGEVLMRSSEKAGLLARMREAAA